MSNEENKNTTHDVSHVVNALTSTLPDGSAAPFRTERSAMSAIHYRAGVEGIDTFDLRVALRNGTTEHANIAAFLTAFLDTFTGDERNDAKRLTSATAATARAMVRVGKASRSRLISDATKLADVADAAKAQERAAKLLNPLYMPRR